MRPFSSGSRWAGTLGGYNVPAARAVASARLGLGAQRRESTARAASARHRDPEGQARHVVPTPASSKNWMSRVSAVLAAHADVQVRLRRPGPAGSPSHQLTDAVDVDRLERRHREDAPVAVGGEERSLDVVAGETRTVWVGSLVPKEKSADAAMRSARRGGAGQLDHGADRDLRVDAALLGDRGVTASSSARTRVSSARARPAAP